MALLMEMKKRVLLLLIAATVCLAAPAQFRWGARAGVNFTNFHFKQDLVKVDQSAGYDVGVLGELMFPGIGFGMDFGLTYQMRGSKIYLGQREIWASEGYGKEQCNLHTLMLPVNLRFKYTNLNGVERTVAPFVYGGPMFSLTVGHSRLKAMEYPEGSILLQCGLGAELYERFQVSAGYYWGMTYELRTRKLDNFSARPQGWLVGVAYMF